MLIDSPRITVRDRTAWGERARYDRILAQSPTWERRIAAALSVIEAWWADGGGVCSTSWGKDSVAVARLAYLTELPIPLVWVRSDPFETPECEQVRDAFLDSHPGVRYEERVVAIRNPKRGEPGHEDHVLHPVHASQDVLGEAIPERYVSGVRAQESRARQALIGHRGLRTRNQCTPIGRWTGPDVFAFAERERLPLHPAYAMSYGGVLDRQWIRVHPLGATLNHDKTDHARWETDYYGDHYDRVLELRAGWRAAGDPRGGVHVPGFRWPPGRVLGSGLDARGGR